MRLHVHLRLILFVSIIQEKQTVIKYIGNVEIFEKPSKQNQQQQCTYIQNNKQYICREYLIETIFKIRLNTTYYLYHIKFRQFVKNKTKHIFNGYRKRIYTFNIFCFKISIYNTTSKNYSAFQSLECFLFNKLS